MARDTPKITASGRDRFGSRYAQRLRREGKLPAVIYGHGEGAAHVALDHEQITHLLHDGAHLLELSHDGGKSETCLIKDVQYDYLGDTIIHVDLNRIDMTEEVTVMVPVELRGEDICPGAQATGAIVEQPMVDIEVTCRANAIPDAIVVDISELGENESYTVADLKLPAGVKAEHEEDEVVVSVHIVEEIPDEELEPATATSEEPEVIAEEQGEEEGGAEGEGETKEKAETE